MLNATIWCIKGIHRSLKEHKNSLRDQRLKWMIADLLPWLRKNFTTFVQVNRSLDHSQRVRDALMNSNAKGLQQEHAVRSCLWVFSA